VNSPDSPLFHKGHLLYGFAQARAAIEARDEAITVEGYLDVVTLHQAGFTHAVSPLSTAVSTAQLSTVRPLAQRLVLLFDGDAAGQAAMTRVFVPAEESGMPV
jgi:DNA primase